MANSCIAFRIVRLTVGNVAAKPVKGLALDLWLLIRGLGALHSATSPQ
jgi:hypothetical protein